ncbi:MAG: rod shape-determining protein MreD [Desulfotomaculales bacterium]
MPALILFAFFMVAVLLESTVLDYTRVAGVKADLVLVLVVFHAIARGPREGALWGFIGGIAQDILTGSHIGLNALVKMLTGYGVGLGESTFYKDSTVIVAGITWLATIFAGIVTYVLLLTLGLFVSPAEAVARVILPLSVYNLAVALLFYKRFYVWETRGFLAPR